MAFDLASAQPVAASASPPSTGGFDLASSRPVETPAKAAPYYGPDPNEPDQMVDPQTMQMVAVPRWKAAQFPSAESFMEAHTNGSNFVAGAGKAFVDTGRGAKQIYAKVADAVAPNDSGPSRSSAVQADIDEARRTDAPLMQTTAGKLGNIAGNVAMAAAVPGAGAEAGLLKAGLSAVGTGAALGAVQPTSGDESRSANTVLGGAAGAGGVAIGKLVAFGLGRILQPVRSYLAPEAQTSVDTLLNAGVPLDASQQTGGAGASTLLRNVANDGPLGPGAFPQKQKEAFTAAALKLIGADSKTADAATMAKVKTNLGQQFEDIATRNPVKVDDGTLMNDFIHVEGNAATELTPAQLSPIQKQIQSLMDIAAANGGYLPGKALQNARSSLGRLQSGQDTALGHWAGELSDTLESALQRTVSPEDTAALAKARFQWKAMKQIEPAIDDSDQISPAKLVNAIDTKRNANQTVYGQGNQSLYDLAKAGKQVISPQTPNSGTVKRLVGMSAAADALGTLGAFATGNIHAGLAGALSLAGIGISQQAAKTLVQNPTAARVFSQWASSKLLANTRNIISNAGVNAGADLGAAARPSAIAQVNPPTAPVYAPTNVPEEPTQDESTQDSVPAEQQQ